MSVAPVPGRPAPLVRRAATRPGARRLLPIGAVAALLGCASGESSPSSGVVADSVRLAPLERAFRLDEASAAAASARHPAIVYTINDSGNEEVLYAFDTTGNAMGRWVMRGTRNRDWEALATGPCATAPEAACVFVGDVGDNALSRPTVLLLQAREPDSLAFGSVGELFSDSLVVRYADGPHNVESLVLAPDGGFLLLPKEVMRRPDGTRRPTLLYRVAPGAWAAGDTAVARLVDSIPIVPGAATRQQVTDAALSRDGRVLAVRTYADVWLFAADSLTGRPLAGVAPVTCNVSALHEPQGEGVGILAVHERRVRLVLTTEGDREPFRFVTCPRPVVARAAGSPTPAAPQSR